MIRLISILVLLLASYAGADVTASSLDRADVQTAITACPDGEVCHLPAGSATWTSSVSLPNTKAITIKGAGRDSTIISSTGQVAFQVDGAHRIQDLEVRILRSGGDGHAVRVYEGEGWVAERLDMFGRNTGDTTDVFQQVVLAQELTAVNPLYGVVADCYISEGTILSAPDTALTKGHAYWNTDYDRSLISSWHTIIEDNVYECDIFGNLADANYGGRYLARGNTSTNSAYEAHSFQSASTRGSRLVAVLDNTMAADGGVQDNFNAYLRATPWLYSGNTVTGFTNVGGFVNVVRGTDWRGTHAGYADGMAAVDGNEAWHIDGTQSTATHTGSDNASVFVDSARSWTPDALIGDWIYNRFDTTTGLTMSRGEITDNDETSITVSGGLSGGTDNDFDTGDQIYIASRRAVGTHTGSNNASDLTDSAAESWTTNEWRTSQFEIHAGSTHDGSENAATLSDSGAAFTWRNVSFSNTLAEGLILHNLTDGSFGVISAATSTTITATLQGGTDNDWDGGDSYMVSHGWAVWNLTDGSRSYVVSNDSTTIITSLTGGTDDDWDTGDEYIITDGYPQRDQTGVGRDIVLSTGSSTQPELWSNQVYEPAYSWDNSAGHNVALSTSGSQTRHLRLGRDVINGVDPGITMPPYPHPLRSSVSSPTRAVSGSADSLRVGGP